MAHQHDINTNFAHILLNVLVQIFTSHLREALSLWMDYVFALSHFLTLSLWDTKKELSQICHLFSRVLLTFFIVMSSSSSSSLSWLSSTLSSSRQQSSLNLSSLLNNLRNFVSLSSDFSEPRPIWTFQL